MASSVKKIQSFFRNYRLDKAQAKAIRAAMQLGEEGFGVSRSKAAEKAMEVINGILDGHGVEAIRGDYHVDRFHYDIVATYVNMGDTYNPTVLYETDPQRFVLTTWGDWVERNERKYGVF